MTPDDHKKGIIRAIQRVGHVQRLPDAPDGPVVDVFEPREIARVIKQEILRSRMNGWPRITMHMDLADALALANALERT